MSSELSILALFGVFSILTIVLQVLMAIPQLGLGYLASARDEQHILTGKAARANRCLTNTVIAMVLFAPAILLLDAKSAFTASTLLAAQIFLVARIVYLPLYILGVPWLRTGVWALGAFATLYLYIAAL